LIESGTPSVERIHGMFQRMLLMRAFDQHTGDARRANRLRGSVHEYIGQGAIAAGVCAALHSHDYISSYHRGTGRCIAKDADVVAMMLELYGRAGGVFGGKGGSMHVADFSLGILGANGVVADGVTIALGAAQAVCLLGEDRIVVAFFGDGALNRGPMLESLNWARVYDLPVLFVCEDNGYSDRTRTASVTGGPGIVARAGATGRLLVAHQAVRVGGFGAEIAAETTEALFAALECAPRRLGAPRVPVPYAEPLEALCRVSEAQLVSTVREMVGQPGTGR